MLTGDSAQCAHYVGRACGMIGEAADLLLADIDSSGDVTWSFVGNGAQDVKLQPSFTTAQVRQVSALASIFSICPDAPGNTLLSGF